MTAPARRPRASAALPTLALPTLALTALLLTGCSASASTSGTASDAALTVAASFYPLEYVAEQVGGDLVAVTTLTPAGVEPHDIELSPAVVRSLSNADLVLYIGGFQPAVEDALDATGAPGFDATNTYSPLSVDEDPSATADPHFWLDPALMSSYSQAIADQFAALDPAHADTYRANAEHLQTDLSALDATFTTGLAQCERRDLITAHQAFGYLAHAYGLNQIGIAGIAPDSEPSPARLRQIAQLVTDTGATTVFTEALVSPRVAQAIAQDAAVSTAVIDPVESVSGSDDYLTVMQRNLAVMRQALGCQ